MRCEGYTGKRDDDGSCEISCTDRAGEGKGRGKGRGEETARPLEGRGIEVEAQRLGKKRDEEGRVRPSRQRAEAAEKGEREGNGVGRGWWWWRR